MSLHQIYDSVVLKIRLMKNVGCDEKLFDYLTCFQ